MGRQPRKGSRPALWRLRRARRRATFRRICQRLGIQRAALLLWLLTTAALIAAALSLNSGSDHVPCTGWPATACTTPPSGHGSSPTRHGTPSQAPQQQASGSSDGAGPRLAAIAASAPTLCYGLPTG
jgi:hypothetical protein